jgi:hypothetical protein
MKTFPLVTAAMLSAPPVVAPRRRVSPMGPLDDDSPRRDSTKPEITPFVAGGALGELITAKGEPTMPKGVYPRTKNGEGSSAPEQPSADAPKKRGRKPGKKAKAAARPAPGRRRDGLPIGSASFVIDDRGGMEIRDGQQSIQLEASDVERLTVFLERTKGIRA